jgi:hypothetical protein
MIRVLAFTLTQVFFHRQMRSRFRKSSFGFCDLARRLADQFLVMAQTNSSSGLSPHSNLARPRWVPGLPSSLDVPGPLGVFLLPHFLVQIPQPPLKHPNSHYNQRTNRSPQTLLRNWCY